jgi:hypothetical protein
MSTSSASTIRPSRSSRGARAAGPGDGESGGQDVVRGCEDPELVLRLVVRRLRGN